MSVIEHSIRYSAAFSAINSLRNLVEYNNAKRFGKVQDEIISDAFLFLTSDDKAVNEKRILYTFHNTSRPAQASALQLSQAINQIIREDSGKDEREYKRLVEEYNSYIIKAKTGTLTLEEKEKLVYYLEATLDQIGRLEGSGKEKNIFLKGI
jgi:hypothetical protein